VSQLLIRAFAALAVAALLIIQARRASARSSRRTAFGFGAAAFAAFALGNGLAAAGLGGQIVLGVSVAGMALMGISLLMLVRAYRGGEMSEKMRRAREMVAEERARTRK
jgi:Na+/H+-translocating membrane pyrophosphatase